MAYEWYADIFCLTSLLMDFCAVYTAGIILNRAVSWNAVYDSMRFGVGVSVSLLFMIPRYAIYSLLVHGMVHPLMTFMVFGGRDRAGYLRALLTVYIVLFVMGGVQNWLTDFERQKNRTDHSVWFCGSTAFYRISGQTQGDEKCLPGRSVAVRKEQDIVGVL